jgi:hypothetical protein
MKMLTRGIKKNYKEKPQYFATIQHKENKSIRKPRAIHQDLIESVQYAAFKMLNPSILASSVKRHTIELSKASAAFLKERYGITGRFTAKENLLEDFGVLKQRLFEQGDFSKIEDGTFKLRMFRRKSIRYFTENLDEAREAVGPMCLSIQFAIRKSTKIDSANSSLSTLVEWTPLE